MVSRTDLPGTLYLICFRTPDGSKGWLGVPGKFGAGHYLGHAPKRRGSFKRGLAERLEEHRNGSGAKITAAAAKAGLVLEVARTWRPATEQNEKAFKDGHHIGALCPLCHPGTRAGTVLKAKQYRRPRPGRLAAAAAAAMAALDAQALVPAADAESAPWPEEAVF